MDIWLAFFTGLTTGGLSCMAVQGGLLAGSLANQIERDITHRTRKKFQFKLAMPITLFLVAKLIAYTLAGFLLGALGSVFELSTTTRGVMQFIIGIFLAGNALRMINLHPVFRIFTFEPPAGLTRFIRRKAKSDDAWITPIFLGLFTVFIPCGITQSVMATAVASGSPINGAVLLFAFTLGTSPVFFILSYFATRLTAVMEKYFVRIIAGVMLILGIISMNTGLNLLGNPYSLSNIGQKTDVEETTAYAGTLAFDGKIYLNVVNDGYKPNLLRAPSNQPVSLNLITNETYSCSRAFVIPELKISKILPATGTVEVVIPPQSTGKMLTFTCSMGMYTGQIVFEG